MFQFIDAERANHPVAIMCRVLEVSRSGFYAWGRRSASTRSRADRTLAERVTEVHGASRRTYGAPRIHAMLAREGTRVGRKRVARLMKEYGIEGVSRRRARRSLTKSDPTAAPAPDRVSRQFSAEGPNQLWVTDITYIATSEGWLYLAIVMDMWSRRIVGWSMRDDMSAPLVVDALQMATTRRRPEAGCIAHSDRGSQGGFNRSSQHLDMEVVRWVFGSVSRRSVPCAARWGRRGDPRRRGVRIGFASGR